MTAHCWKRDGNRNIQQTLRCLWQCQAASALSPVLNFTQVGVKYTVQGTNVQSWTVFLGYSKERVAGIVYEFYYALKGHIAQSDLAGEAGPCYRRPRVSKLAQERLSGLSPLGWDGSLDSQAGGWSVWTEADSRAAFSKDAQTRDNSRQPKNLVEKGGKVTAYGKESTYSLFLVGFLWMGELVSVKIMTMSENQSSWSQVHVTAIPGTEKTRLRAQFK